MAVLHYLDKIRIGLVSSCVLLFATKVFNAYTVQRSQKRALAITFDVPKVKTNRARNTYIISSSLNLDVILGAGMAQW